MEPDGGREPSDSSASHAHATYGNNTNTIEHAEQHGDSDEPDDGPNEQSDEQHDQKSVNCQPNPPVKQSVVFNYSGIELSEPMIKLLNRGLNFSILPYKCDITQVLADYKRFERSVIWTEFWHGRTDCNIEKQIFKQHKTNLPKNYSVPEGLKVFLSSVKSEILDPKN